LIGFCVYNIVIICFVGVPINHILREDQITARFILRNCFVIFCTTLTLCILFIPKVMFSIITPYLRILDFDWFRLSNLINHVILRIKVKKKYSEWIWRFEAREGKKVKYVFANTTTQREKKLNPYANTPAVVKMHEFNPKYENTHKMHRLSHCCI
jgi:hypothetical protein